MINHIIVDDAEEYLHFLQDLFPHFEKYKADEQLQKLLERIEYIMNEFHIATPCDRALLLDYKAELLLEDGKPEKALKKRKRAIEIMEKEYTQTIDRRTVSLLSNLYNNVGTIYTSLYKKDDAAAYFEKAFLIRIKHKELDLVETHDLLQQMMNLTNVWLAQNRTDEAENILAHYEIIVTEKLGTDSLDYGICKLIRGIIALKQCRYSESEHFLSGAEHIFQHTMPQSNDYLNNARQYLYSLYMKQGKYSLAKTYNPKLNN